MQSENMIIGYLEILENNSMEKIIGRCDKENCEIYINENRITLDNEFLFEKNGKYTIKFIFRKLLKSTYQLFDDCKSFISLDLSKFNTQNVEDMGYMFRDCKSLKSLDLSNLNTHNVRKMDFMFNECKSLISLDLSSFNTQNVKNMKFMFKDCKSLVSLDLSKFNTQKYKIWI